MNIIFLDVDGVLNSEAKLIRLYNETHDMSLFNPMPFDEICLENLNILVRETNSKIVVTSTWRHTPELKERLIKALEDFNLDKEIIGYTPHIQDATRGAEINGFLSKINYKPHFIILDDNDDMENLLPYLIKIDSRVGLTDQNIEEGVLKLPKPRIKNNNEFER